MKKNLIFFFAVFVFACSLFADYRSVLLEANRAYKIGDYSAALELYKQAYDLKPSKQLEKFIKKLEEKIGPVYVPVDPKADWAKQESVLYINLVPILFNQINISYKRAIGPSFSLGVSAFYSWDSGDVIFMPTNSIFSGSTNYTAYGGGIDIDYYIDGKSPNGLYGGFGLNIGHTDFSLFGISVTGMASLHVGYRWIFKWGGSVEVQAAYTIAYLTMSYMPYLMGNNLNVGWAF